MPIFVISNANKMKRTKFYAVYELQSAGEGHHYQEKTLKQIQKFDSYKDAELFCEKADEGSYNDLTILTVWE